MDLRRGCSQTLPLRAAPNTSGKLGKGDILKGSKGEGSTAGSSSGVPGRVLMGMPRSRQRDSGILSFTAPGAPGIRAVTHTGTRKPAGPPEPPFIPKLLLKTEDQLFPGESVRWAESRICKQRLPRCCTALRAGGSAFPWMKTQRGNGRAPCYRCRQNASHYGTFHKRQKTWEKSPCKSEAPVVTTLNKGALIHAEPGSTAGSSRPWFHIPLKVTDYYKINTV